MKALDKWIAYGVTECERAGHTLRTRAGHCIQCDSKKVAYLMRHKEDGEIYVAYSARGNIVKVGTSKKSATVRLDGMNSDKYGGCSDWTIAYIVPAPQAGRVESKVHRTLAEHAISASYYKNGKITKCRELFSCSVGVAKRAIMEAMGLTEAGKSRAVRPASGKSVVTVKTKKIPPEPTPKVSQSRPVGAEKLSLKDILGWGEPASSTVQRKTPKPTTTVQKKEEPTKSMPKVHRIWRFGYWTKYRL